MLVKLFRSRTHDEIDDECDRDKPHDPADFLVLADSRLHEYVADEAEGKAVGDRARQRHHDDRQEGRQAVREVDEVDLADLAHHQRADEDQRRSRRKARHEADERSEEQRDEEADGHRDSRQARLAASRDAGSALDVARDRRRTEDRGADRADCIRRQSTVEVLDLAVRLDELRLRRQADQRAHVIEELNDREREDDGDDAVIPGTSDVELAERLADDSHVVLSSANSINIGRLVPQIVYYVYAYAKLYANGVIGKDERINVVVPTGNFGNILAAFYAKNMGIPIAKLICASNENKVLYDFFTTGTYDKNREFMLTSSPSMDILISSNLERLIYRIAGNDAAKNADFMKALNTNGKYEITPAMKEQLADFYGNYTSEEETAEEIRNLYEKTGYIIDTHTAVATGVYHKYLKDTKDTDTKTVIASTASPFKFTRSVMDAIDKKYDAMTDFELVDELSKIGNVKIPNAIEEIRTAEVRHKTVCEVDEMPKVVKEFLNVK